MTSMPIDLRPSLPPPPKPALGLSTLDIAAFSYEDPGTIYLAITEALDLCGCWLLDRRPTSLTQVEFSFELQLRSVVDLYAALIAAGLELTRASHNDLTVFCMLRKHQDNSLAGVVTVQLVVNFFEDAGLPPMPIRTAHA